jgi:hypothetical protein
LNKPWDIEKLKAHVREGWYIMGQAYVWTGSEIATPDNPDGIRQAVLCNVWVINTAMIPAGLVAETLLRSKSKDELCELLFGVAPEELQRQVEAQSECSHG